MKRSLHYLAFSLIMIFSSCQKSTEKGELDLDLLKIRFQKEDVNWSKSAKTNDATYISNLYTKDAVLGIPSQPFVNGKEQISKKWQQTVELVDDLSFETISLSGTKELLYETGYAFTSYKVNEKPIVDTSKYLIVWEHAGNDEYKIVADLFNSISPPEKN